MRYIKTYEQNNIVTELNYHSYSNVKHNDHGFLTDDLIADIGLNINKPKGESIYNIDVYKILREIYLNKKINFNNGDKWITGIVTDVKLDYWLERDKIYILVKIDDNWYRISYKYFNIVYDYDAENKPEHQKLKIAKKAEQYNI